MKVPMSWLKNYVPVTVSPKELAHLLTMAGIEVGEVEDAVPQWDRHNILVGHILKVEQHPNADRLTLPTVDLGNGEIITVVCGAPNVAIGQKIAFAREGAMLLNPRSGQIEELKLAVIRGVESAGMVCSSLELGLGEDHDGILVLDDDAPIGTGLINYLGDAVLDIEVTPNRPDCLSMLGVAHEVAALTGSKVAEPDLFYVAEGHSVDGQVKIEIADPDLCYRYTASLVTGITVGDSPRWMQNALIKAGQRPINNVVDITNYVMLEYDQPLHAFDFDMVKDRTIIVRRARAGETLVTLDGERRVLNPPMLTIADSEGAIGLAGVMGGANSEMRPETTSVLIESANFDPVNTRITSNALRLSTEASYRFERGLRAGIAPLALKRATQLILEICGGVASQGIIDLYPGPKEPPFLTISKHRIKQLLGVDFSTAEIERVLVSLGFELVEPRLPTNVSEKLEESLSVKVPYWRSDILIEEDLVEEIARIVGYDKIPTVMLSTPIPHHKPQPRTTFRDSIKDILAASGLQEIISYSLTNLDTLGKVQALHDSEPPIKIANPMSSELEYLRTTLRGSIIQTLSYNRRVVQSAGIKLFEIGNTYLPAEETANHGLPNEKEMLIGIFSGPRFTSSWQGSWANMDFFDAKGVLESMFDKLGAEVEYESAQDTIMRPGRTARLVCNGHYVGIVGELLPSVLECFALECGAVALLEIDMESLRQAVPETGRGYQASNRFPEASRDLAILVDVNVPSASIQSIIRDHKLVVRSSAFDVYSGGAVPAGKKSIAYNVMFQSSSGTLTSQQIDRAQQDILLRLKQHLGAQLRE